jgi:hypothetical protein
MTKNHTTADKKSPLLMLFLYLFLSLFTGLIFSILLLKQKIRVRLMDGGGL